MGVKTISQKQYATWLGIILLAVGILGLLQGDGDLLGVFSVNGTHTWVHLLSGFLALLAGLTASGSYAGTYNRVFGIVYLLVGILGFLNLGFLVGLLMLNAADNVLHVIIGVVMTWVGFKKK